MSLDKAKLKRFASTIGKRPPKKNPSNQSGGSLEEVVAPNYDINEGAGKRHHTPEFVQHCVTAITENPAKLADVEVGGEDGEKGSPFAICNAAYKKKTKSKAASHSRGAHHSVKEYEAALKKLREDTMTIRETRPPRGQIIFKPGGPNEPKRSARGQVQFRPE